MAILAGGMAAASIHDTENGDHGGDDGVVAEGGVLSGMSHGEEQNGEASGEVEGAGGVPGGLQGSAAAAMAAAVASTAGVAGEHRSAADGGGMWVEPPVVVKKYNKVGCEGRCFLLHYMYYSICRVVLEPVCSIFGQREPKSVFVVRLCVPLEEDAERR